MCVKKRYSILYKEYISNIVIKFSFFYLFLYFDKVLEFWTLNVIEKKNLNTYISLVMCHLFTYEIFFIKYTQLWPSYKILKTQLLKKIYVCSSLNW